MTARLNRMTHHFVLGPKARTINLIGGELAEQPVQPIRDHHLTTPYRTLRVKFNPFTTYNKSIAELLLDNYIENLNPFPHTTILQQKTLNIFCQKIENLGKWMDNLLLTVENIVAKGDIAHFEQFLLCHYVFKKLSTSEGVYMRERVKK